MQLGGYTGSVNLNTVERYDPISNTWSFVSPMPTTRGALSATTLGGYIYVIGGDNGNLYISANERYDPQTDSWSTMTTITRIFCKSLSRRNTR